MTAAIESARVNLLLQLAAGPVPSRAIVAAGEPMGAAADGLVDEGIAEPFSRVHPVTYRKSRHLRLTPLGRAAVRNGPAGVP